LTEGDIWSSVHLLQLDLYPTSLRWYVARLDWSPGIVLELHVDTSGVASWTLVHQCSCCLIERSTGRLPSLCSGHLNGKNRYYIIDIWRGKTDMISLTSDGEKQILYHWHLKGKNRYDIIDIYMVQRKNISTFGKCIIRINNSI